MDRPTDGEPAPAPTQRLRTARRADRIFLIPGWQDSQGARIESFTANVLGIYRLPHGKKDELEKEMKEWMKQQDETRVLQSPREQSIRKYTKEHKKV